MKLTTKIDIEWKTKRSVVLDRAWKRWLRDVSMTLIKATSSEKNSSQFIIALEEALDNGTYKIEVDAKRIFIIGGDELGVIYALLFLSETFLKITPFWYWNDQNFRKQKEIHIIEGYYESPEYKFQYRGWFINDEVLLDYWGKESYDEETGVIENFAFEMAMEALLRLEGNMVIPGTDQNSHKYKKLAVHMGLTISHHHAEPLGAKMFARVYPNLVPSYDLYPERFEALWREAIEEQKDYNVVWNIGFRGQGDRPFWADDKSYDTPEKRGKLISCIIKKQYDMICEYVNNPVCCTNLYGEMMELYQQGHIALPSNIIYIWADNGYGKMVSRRQGKHNPRIKALPSAKAGHHGSYYHVSFYDLQSANHITMLPNGMDFVEQELQDAMEHGINDFLKINCSNVRPHTYTLDKVARIWGKEERTYTELYFPTCSAEIEDLYQQYPKVMLKYGTHEDEYAGEQYYHYSMRAICNGWLLGKFNEPEKSLIWLTGSVPLKEQITFIQEQTKKHLVAMQHYYDTCKVMASKMMASPKVSEEEEILFKDSLLLQATIHNQSLFALHELCMAYTTFEQGDYEEAFTIVGGAMERIHRILDSMKMAEHGKWADFYTNDCLTDIKFTGYIMERIMGYIRQIGDGPDCYMWALKYMYPNMDNKVVLITNMRNHPTDWELYEAMKDK